MAPQPAAVSPEAAQAPIEAPQARFHPVPVRPVFLLGSYRAPQGLQQLPSGTIPRLQGPKLDEPPPFPEPEEVGPPEPHVDGKVSLRQAAARAARTAAWVFMPSAANASAEEISIHPTFGGNELASGNWTAADPTRDTSAPMIVATTPLAEPRKLVLPPADQLRPAKPAAPLDKVSHDPTGAPPAAKRKRRPVWSPRRPAAMRRVAQ